MIILLAYNDSRELILSILAKVQRSMQRLKRECHEIGSKEVEREVLKLERLNFVELPDLEYILTRKGRNVSKAQLAEARKSISGRMGMRFNRTKMYHRNKK